MRIKAALAAVHRVVVSGVVGSLLLIVDVLVVPEGDEHGDTRKLSFMDGDASKM